jgi:protein-L-isoaspartate(D-aspartate) O-methyltransferase
MRRQLVAALRERGISDEAVLAAIGAVPRHFFLDKAFEEHAYDDKPFPIGNKQTISQPFTVAYQTALLEIQAGDRVLEIGTGSGYQAAILAALGASVFTVERQEALHARSKKLLAQLGFTTVQCFFSDGTLGLPELAPFNQIIVTAGAKEVPEALLRQLAPSGGTLVIPVGEQEQQMLRIRRNKKNFSTETFDMFRFVPFLGGLERK